MNESQANLPDVADESALLPTLKQRLAALRQRTDRVAIGEEYYLCRLYNRIRKRTPHGLGDMEIPQLS